MNALIHTPRSWQDAIELVTPFASGDETRPHLFSPAVWEDHAVATDGHTLCAARAAGERSGPVGSVVGNPNARPPPWEYVVPETIEPFGSFTPSSCEPLEYYPNTWAVTVEWRPSDVRNAHPSTGHTLSAKRPLPRERSFAGHSAPLPMVEGMSVATWFPHVRVPHPVGISAHYLWRVAELYTAPPAARRPMYRARPIHVFGNPSDALAPLVFAAVATPRTKSDLMALDSFAIVMPVRM